MENLWNCSCTKKLTFLSKNDLRPVALTSVLMKCLESIVKKHICKCVENLCDEMQFAYRQSICVDDAGTTLIHVLCAHLDKCKTYSQVLFVDFSSAFNTIQMNFELLTFPCREMIKLSIHMIYDMFPKWIHFYTENFWCDACIVYIDIAKLQMRFLHYAFLS